MNFRNNYLTIILTTLFVLLVGSSYLRFVHNYDYQVTYEGDCDPLTESCFVGCEDEECTSEYYYKNVYKSASALYEQCGDNITDCEAAQVCLEAEGDTCFFEYCIPDEGECAVVESEGQATFKENLDELTNDSETNTGLSDVRETATPSNENTEEQSVVAVDQQLEL